jgi:thiamine biosynthesis lipoprotein
MRKAYSILLMLTVLLGVVSCTQMQEYSETRELMGTSVKITVVESNETRARIAMEKAFTEISRVEQVFSNHINTSAVSKLNQDKQVTANPEFLSIITDSIHYSDLSSGAFDITVQPVLSLLSRTYSEENRPPTGKEMEEACGKVGYDRISMIGKTVIIDEGMEVTLGGIAKGYAVDKAMDVLKDEGIEDALINAGGDMKGIGESVDGPWVVALQNPRDENDFITLFYLEDKAVATSGDYERYFVPDKKVHHILDPKRCKSATDAMSVTVIADDAKTADVLSTTIFVLGPDDGLELAERLDSIEALIIDSERMITRTSGFPE